MKVTVFVESARLGLFFELLSTGIVIKTPMGVSVREFLCRIMGIEPMYVDTHIQTIFLNGRALDDIDGALLADGAVLALSSAMPGLAGAVFRRGGAYATLRSNVSATPNNCRKSSSEGTIILKLFNQVAADLGPSFFKNGVRVKGHSLSQFLQHNREKLQKISASIEVEGKKCLFNQFTDIESVADDIWLTIETT
jgi:hypothetical protein